MIYKDLQEIVSIAEHNDTILFYFAGHGMKKDQRGYLLVLHTSRDIGLVSFQMDEEYGHFFMPKSEAA